jgi:cell division septation protein DedD
MSDKLLDRIATALETIAANSNHAGGTSVKVAPPVGGLPAGKPTAAKPAGKPTAAAKPKPAVEPEPEPETEDAPELTREAVGEKIVALIQANQRPAAVKILKDHGAKAVSELKPEDFASAYEAAAAILDTL